MRGPAWIGFATLDRKRAGRSGEYRTHVDTEPFNAWRLRPEAEGPTVTLIDLYAAVAAERGLAADELPLAERNRLRDLALPVMWPGFAVVARRDRAPEPITVVPYDPAWAGRFESWRERLAGVLPAAQRIDHVGSTAVPGLAAKSVIDIQVSVADPSRESEYVPQLVGLGLELRSRDDEHGFFRPLSGTPREVHVHVCATGSSWEYHHLLFRDYLRDAPAARDEYLAAKLDAAERWRDDRVAYADAKTAVILRVMRDARAWASQNAWRL